MATISNTPRPGYVWDSADNVWYPIGVGAHQHTNAADTPAVMPYSTYAAAGKNKLINGDFAINQYGFTSASNGTAYVADRWKYSSSATATTSRETFTPGAAPVSGYEGRNYLRMVTSGQSGAGAIAAFTTRVEDVRTFAGQTTTLSFWARASSGTPFVAADWLQLFGTGGSSPVVGTGQKVAITTSWARYSFTFNIDSVAGKTISTSNDSSVQIEIWTSAGTDYNSRTASMGIQSATIDIWGVQWEAGSTVTAFQTATGNPASELAACQRYYYRSTANGYQYFATAANSQTTITLGSVFFPVTMRTSPSLSASAGNTFMAYQGTSIIAGTSIASDGMQPNVGGIGLTVASGLTVGNAVSIRANNTAAFLEFNAEL
jgi:hypothetical protein